MKMQSRPCTVRLKRKCVKRSTLRNVTIFLMSFFLLLICGISFGLALLLSVAATAIVCVLISRT